jgi:hypothetical protein
MARGWESKEVESQIESAAEARRVARETPQLSEAERRKQHEIAGLQLSRTRVLHELEAARHLRHREMLEAALRDLDAKIAALG